MSFLNIPRPDLPFYDPKSGQVDKQWYAFLIRLDQALAAVDTIVNGLTFADIAGTLSLAQLPAHQSTHNEGGTDELKLDALGIPDDVTTLNADSNRHGLLIKLSGNGADRLGGDGAWH